MDIVFSAAADNMLSRRDRKWLHELPVGCSITMLYSELRSCVKVEVAVLGSASLIALNKHGLFGRKATLKSNLNHVGGMIS